MHYQDDTSLVRDVESALTGMSGVKTGDIKVKADNGDVTLDGVVDTAAQRQSVSEAVRAMPGVRSVKNELRLRGEGSQSVGEYVDDAMITASVKAKLMGESGLESLKTHVETKDGIVTLTGETDSRDHYLQAERVAGMADGVKKVHNRLTVRP